MCNPEAKIRETPGNLQEGRARAPGLSGRVSAGAAVRGGNTCVGHTPQDEGHQGTVAREAGREGRRALRMGTRWGLWARRGAS